MRIDPTLRRIRAIIRAATVNVAVRAGTIRSSVLVPYIRIRTAFGEFFKQKFISDTARVSEGEIYFAEDYVEPGYVGIPFFIVFSKVLSDGSTVTDTFAIYAPKNFSDTATLADVAVVAPTKGLSEALTLTDPAARSVTKIATDAATLADAAVLRPTKVVSDTTTAADAAIRSAAKVLSEAPTLADQAIRALTKPISDSLTLADQSTLRPTKGLSETLTLADVVARVSGLAIIDQPVVSDTGSLRMQDYCSFDYFAEDYVGQSRVFT